MAHLHAQQPKWNVWRQRKRESSPAQISKTDHIQPKLSGYAWVLKLFLPSIHYISHQKGVWFVWLDHLKWLRFKKRCRKLFQSGAWIHAYTLTEIWLVIFWHPFVRWWRFCPDNMFDLMYLIGLQQTIILQFM